MLAKILRLPIGTHELQTHHTNGTLWRHFLNITIWLGFRKPNRLASLDLEKEADLYEDACFNIEAAVEMSEQEL